ncbi:MAG: GDCCVxC domain-containing (seleno)protein [Hyphomicrobiaceae bacterium]
MNVQTKSEICCPSCGHKATDTMPADACVGFYSCTGCGKELRPKPGDCCVFCSYGTVPCPPVQCSSAQKTQPQGRT